MVSPPIIVIDRLATPATTAETQHRVNTHNAPISHLEHLRESLSKQGLKLLISSLTLGDQKIVNHMTHYSTDGTAGALDGVQIPFQDL